MQIEIQSLSFSYDKKIDTISNVSLTINSGNRIFLTGKAGSGKTTFLNLLNVNLIPDKGSILIDEQNTRLFKKKKLNSLRKTIGFSSHNDFLIPDLNCYENLILASLVFNIDKKEANKKTLEVLAGMKISYLRTKLPSELSAGEKKLITLARSIIHSPTLLIIDEPIENISISEFELAIKYIFETINKDTIVIIASQNESIQSFIPESSKIELIDGKIIDNKTSEKP